MSNATFNVEFPSGTVKPVNMLVLLAEVQDAEWRARTGMPFPGTAKLHRTLRDVREKYEIPAHVARTWAQLAPLLRQFHTDMKTAIAEAREAA